MRVKKLWLSGLFFLLVSMGIYAGFLWRNNRSAEPASKAEIRQSLNAGIGWLFRHKKEILKVPNPMPWWMLQQSGVMTGDLRLKELFSSYDAAYLANNMNNIWRPLFYKNSWSPVRYESIRQFPYYIISIFSMP